MDAPVVGSVSAPPFSAGTSVAGLFGKLPAHGDFVRRGWADATVDAVDRWLTETIAVARSRRDDAAFTAWMHGAPLWRGYVPAGRLGPTALHLAIAPSVDRAGRLFPIVAGVAGDDRAAWTHATAGGAGMDAAIYDALAGRTDADALLAVIGRAVPVPNGGDAPASSCWWLLPDGEPAVWSDGVDAALLERLMNEGQR